MLQVKLPIRIATSKHGGWAGRLAVVRTCSSRAFIGILKHADNGSEIFICVMFEDVKSAMVCVVVKCTVAAKLLLYCRSLPQAFHQR